MPSNYEGRYISKVTLVKNIHDNILTNFMPGNIERMQDVVDCVLMYKDYQADTMEQSGSQVLSVNKFVDVVMEFTKKRWRLNVGPYGYNGATFMIFPLKKFTDLYFISLKPKHFTFGPNKNLEVKIIEPEICELTEKIYKCIFCVLTTIHNPTVASVLTLKPS